MQLILLSAGRGSRLPKKFRDKPKSMAIVNKKTILENNLQFYNKFKKKIIITGYKNKFLRRFAKDNKFKFVINNKYRTTNMVYSTFLASKYITQDVVVCYGDIIFDSKIFNLLKDTKDILPVKRDWLKIWKKRMPENKIKFDAEDLEIKNNMLIRIGEKINKEMPKYQYMGILKLKKKSYSNLNTYFKNLKNEKIDMTSFLNYSIKNDKLKFHVKKNKLKWLEIDNQKDLKVANEEIKKW